MKSFLLSLIAIAFISIFVGCDEDSNPTGSNGAEKKTQEFHTLNSAPDGMVVIKTEGKSFFMGGSISDSYTNPVSFTYDYCIDTVEVSMYKFDSLMSASYDFYSTPTHYEYVTGDKNKIPAVDVSWNAAILYANAKSKAEGRDTVYSYSGTYGFIGKNGLVYDVTCDFTKNGYRLPTRAEWEFAAEGGVQDDYYWGKNYNDVTSAADTIEISKYAVWSANSQNQIGTISTKLPNAYGLYDMAGNAREWVNDYAGGYSTGTVLVDPIGADSNDKRTVLGGGYRANASELKASEYNYEKPNESWIDYGFRLACSAE